MDQNVLKDSVPPKNIEAEQAVLGALLLNWNEAIADVVSYLRPDRFYSVQNQVIFVGKVPCFFVLLVDRVGWLKKRWNLPYLLF